MKQLLAERRQPADRRQAAEQIRFQARLLECVNQAVIATDLDGTITYWNRFAEVLYGWSAAQMLGRSASVLTPHSASGAQIATIMARLHAGES